MASDLRLVVSVLRVLGELERIGDLVAAGRASSAADHDLLTRRPASFDIARSPWPTRRSSASATRCGPGRPSDLDLADRAGRRRRTAAWTAVPAGSRRCSRWTDADAVAVAMRTPGASGQALDRIADHAAIIGARLRYLLTGDPDHLAAEVR